MRNQQDTPPPPTQKKRPKWYWYECMFHISRWSCDAYQHEAPVHPNWMGRWHRSPKGALLHIRCALEERWLWVVMIVRGKGHKQHFYLLLLVCLVSFSGHDHHFKVKKKHILRDQFYTLLCLSKMAGLDFNHVKSTPTTSAQLNIWLAGSFCFTGSLRCTPTCFMKLPQGNVYSINKPIG